MFRSLRTRTAIIEAELAATRTAIGNLRAAALVQQALTAEFGAEYAFAATEPADLPVRLAEVIPFPRQATR